MLHLVGARTLPDPDPAVNRVPDGPTDPFPPDPFPQLDPYLVELLDRAAECELRALWGDR